MANQNYKEAWQIAMDKLRKEYTAKGKEDDFSIWFNINYVEDTVNTITVSVASTFMKQMIENKGYFNEIQSTLREMMGNDNITLNPIVVANNKSENQPKTDNLDKLSNSDKTYKSDENDDSNKKFEVKDDSEINNTKKEFKKHPLLQEEFTFDTFIPGENSNFAYNAAIAVAKNPGKLYNPILLYGGSGLGKTHLMQAIGNYIYNNGGEKLKICYTSAESFTNEFITSTQKKTTDSFKDKYRNLDVLLLDDIHFLQNKDATQEELFYTFNALHEKHAQMVFTCDRPIKEIKNITARLVSRLSNGLCIDIKTPDYETRCAILQKKAEQSGKNLNPEVIDYIAKNIETNVRELESALQQVIAYSEIIEQEPNLEIAKSQLRDIIFSSSSENISLDTILKVIADEFHISVSDLKSKKRDKKFAMPRHIAIYLAREMTEISYSEIGEEFMKDHSTIMHAYSNISEKIKFDPSLDSKIKIFMREIKEYRTK